MPDVSEEAKEAIAAMLEREAKAYERDVPGCYAAGVLHEAASLVRRWTPDR